MQTSPSTLGERITIARKRRRMSQTQLAARCGLAASTLSKVESGIHRTVQSRAVRSLAKVLDVTTDYLLGMEMSDDEVIDRPRHGGSLQPER